MVQLKVCLAAAAALTLAAGVAHASTDVTGELYFGGGSTNYYNASAGYVPTGLGFDNEFGNPVTIDDNVEFGFQDGRNLDAADFTGTTLSIYDLVYDLSDTKFLSGSDPWTQKFTASKAGFFKGITLTGNTFSGLTWSVAGDTLTVNWVGTDQPGYYQADFSFNGVPEPTTWAMMIVGLGLAGATLRHRRRVAVAA